MKAYYFSNIEKTLLIISMLLSYAWSERADIAGSIWLLQNGYTLTDLINEGE